MDNRGNEELEGNVEMENEQCGNYVEELEVEIVERVDSLDWYKKGPVVICCVVFLLLFVSFDSF